MTSSSTPTACRAILCLVSLVPLVGVGLTIHGLSQPQIRHNETGYVCGDAPPAIVAGQESIPCFRLSDSRAADRNNTNGRRMIGDAVTPTGPLCPLAGAPGVYCYERVEGYGPTSAFLWWSSYDDEDNGGQEQGASDEEHDDDGATSTPPCWAGRWRVFHSWDDALADRYGWYRKFAPNATLATLAADCDGDDGGWELRKGGNAELWVDAPFLSLSSCSSSSSMAPNGTVPAECFVEQVHYEDSIFSKVGIYMVVSPFLCGALACIVGIVWTIIQGGPVQSLICLGLVLSLADIGWHCAEMYLLLIFSSSFVVLVGVAVAAVVEAIKAVWARKRGVVLEAKVHGRRRTLTGTDENGRRAYCHWLLVTYEVPLRGQGSIYRRVPVSETKQRNTAKGLEPVRKWLSVGQVAYDNVNRNNRSIDVLVLPGRPEDAISAGDAPGACENVVLLLLPSAMAVGFSIPGVGMAREAFFSDEYCQMCGDVCCDSCTLWHVKTAYVAAAVLLPAALALLVASKGKNENAAIVAVEDGDQDLPTLQVGHNHRYCRNEDAETVATEDATILTQSSDLHLEADIREID